MTMTVTVTVGVLPLSHCQNEFRACNTTESVSKVTIMLVVTVALQVSLASSCLSMHAGGPRQAAAGQPECQLSPGRPG